MHRNPSSNSPEFANENISNPIQSDFKQGNDLEEFKGQQEAYPETMILKLSLLLSKVSDLKSCLKQIWESWNKEAVELLNFINSSILQFHKILEGYHEREKIWIINLKEKYEYQNELFSKCLKENESAMKAKDELIQWYMKNISERERKIGDNLIKPFEIANKIEETSINQLQKVESGLGAVISTLQNELSSFKSSCSLKIEMLEAELKRQAEEKNKEINSLNDSIKALTSEKHESAIAQKDKEISDLQYKINGLIDENERIKRELANIQDNSNFQIELERFKQENESLKLQISDFRKQSSGVASNLQASSSGVMDRGQSMSEFKAAYEEEKNDAKIIRKQDVYPEDIEYEDKEEWDEEVEEEEEGEEELIEEETIEIEGNSDDLTEYCMNMIIEVFNGDSKNEMMVAAYNALHILKQFNDPKYKELTERVEQVTNNEDLDWNLYKNLVKLCKKLRKERISWMITVNS